MARHADTNPPPQQLVDAATIAAVLDISLRQVYRLVARGKIPYHRVGVQLRFDRDKVLAWSERTGGSEK